jgi:hypothetical protein
MTADASLDAATAALRRARASQPAPLSTLASELLFELSARTPDWGRIFLLQIDLFEASVAFLGFVLIAELERHPGAVHQSSSHPTP